MSRQQQDPAPVVLSNARYRRALARWSWFQRLRPEVPPLDAWKVLAEAFISAASTTDGKVVRQLAAVSDAGSGISDNSLTMREEFRRLVPETLSLPGRRQGHSRSMMAMLLRCVVNYRISLVSIAIRPLPTVRLWCGYTCWRRMVVTRR